MFVVFINTIYHHILVGEKNLMSEMSCFSQNLKIGVMNFQSVTDNIQFYLLYFQIMNGFLVRSTIYYDVLHRHLTGGYHYFYLYAIVCVIQGISDLPHKAKT